MKTGNRSSGNRTLVPYEFSPFPDRRSLLIDHETTQNSGKKKFLPGAHSYAFLHEILSVNAAHSKKKKNAQNHITWM